MLRSLLAAVALSGATAILPGMAKSGVELDREQQKVLRHIHAEARHVPRAGGLRRKFKRAAAATGLVEDNLHNSANVRDHDSKNWRQERESGYGDEWAETGGPLNLKASMRRFRQEFMDHADPGERAGDIAAQVQRPAAQYRGRYQERIRSGEAQAVLRATRPGGGGGGGGRPGMRGVASALPAFDPGAMTPQQMVQAGLPPQALVPTGSVAPPAHAAQAVMPTGAQLPGGGGAPQARTSLADALGALAPQDLPGMAGGGAGRRGARGARGRGGRGGAANVEGLANEAAEIGASLGIKGGSRDRTPGGNAAVGGSEGSDHLEGGGVPKRGREAVDLPTTAQTGGWEQYRKMVRQLGGKPATDGFSQFEIERGGRRFRVQVIFGDKHGHGDHIHVGFKRAD